MGEEGRKGTGGERKGVRESEEVNMKGRRANGEGETARMGRRMEMASGPLHGHGQSMKVIS